MKRRKKQNRILLLIVLVIGVSIGYAALATTLKINGTSTVKGLNWNIYWDNVQVTNGSVTGANVTTTPTTVGKTTQTVTFSVTLPEPGDYYEFTVDAVNEGTIDAMVADEGVTKKAYSDAGCTQEVNLPDVLRYTVTDSNGNAIADGRPLAKMSGNTPTRDTYKVRVEYRNDSEINPSDLDPANDRTYYFKFEVTYVQSTANKFARKTSGNPTELAYGDEIKISDEGFNIVSTNAETTVLLAKYNLNVSNSVDFDYGEYQMQNPLAIGYNSDKSTSSANGYPATLFFATSHFWDDPSTEYPHEISSDNYSIAVLEENQSILTYVYEYKRRLEEMGATITKARLLNYDELINIFDCNTTTQACTAGANGAFFFNTSFWTGVVCGINGTYANENGKFNCFDSYAQGSFGVRPVIEIPTSAIITS